MSLPVFTLKNIVCRPVCLVRLYSEKAHRIIAGISSVNSRPVRREATIIYWLLSKQRAIIVQNHRYAFNFA